MFLSAAREHELGLDSPDTRKMEVKAELGSNSKTMLSSASSPGKISNACAEEIKSCDQEEVQDPPQRKMDPERSAKIWRKLKTMALIMSMHAYISEKQRVLEIFKQGDALAELEEGEEVHIAMQGNIDFYSVENQKKRKAMKRHPEIEQRIQTLWDVADMKKTPEGNIEKESFILLMIRLHFLMVPPPVNLEKALINADEDWTKDTGGAKIMTFQKFRHSMFELVDVWTETIDMEEYKSLLDRIIDGVTKIDPEAVPIPNSPKSSPRIFKDLNEICFDASFSQLDGKVANEIVDINNLDCIDQEVDDDEYPDSDSCYEDDEEVMSGIRRMSQYEASFRSLKEGWDTTGDEEDGGVLGSPLVGGRARPGMPATNMLSSSCNSARSPLPQGPVNVLGLTAPQVLEAAGADPTGVTITGERLDGVMVGDGRILGANGQVAEELSQNASPLRVGQNSGIGVLDLGQKGLEKRAQKIVGKKLWKQLRKAANAVGAIKYKKLEVRSTNLAFYTNQSHKRRVVMKPEKVMQTIAKIYDAKYINDQMKAKRAAAEKMMKIKKGGRFDTYILRWHLQQYGTRKMAQRKLRLLLFSVRRLARFHPRIQIFAKMVGIPIEAEPGVEIMDPKYKPRAATQFLLPLLVSFLKRNQRTQKLERLEKWFGSGFEPKLIPKNDFLAAVDKCLRWIPRNSPQVMKFHMEIGELAVDESGREILLNQKVKENGDSEISKRKRRGKKRQYLDVDKAILLLLPVWDAEEEWKQTMITISAILMIQRWVRRVRKKIQPTLSIQNHEGQLNNSEAPSPASSRPVEKLREAQMLDKSISA